MEDERGRGKTRIERYSETIVTNHQEANGEKSLYILYLVPVPQTDTGR